MKTAAHSAFAPAEEFTLLLRRGRGRRPLDCWLALPPAPADDAPPIVAVHGIGRGAMAQARLLGARAAAEGRLVVAPVFAAETWPLYQQVVRRGRADLALLGLMRELRAAGLWRTGTFDLCGFSGGAQFAHRFAMLYPQMVSRLTVASAGWYTFPDSAPFPYGLGSAEEPRRTDWASSFAAGLDGFLRMPIQICVGERDDLPDENTRRGPRIDVQQGADRRTRAARWSNALRRAAKRRGIAPRIVHRVLPGCRHDFDDCVRRGGLDRMIVARSACRPARRGAAGPAEVRMFDPSLATLRQL